MGNEQSQAPLVVVAAAIVTDRGLLLVSKRVAPDVFYLPGGKPEPGEADEACLAREVAEELDASVETSSLFTLVSCVAALEGTPMEMTVYLVTLDREPRAASEIAALDWFSPHRPFTGVLAPAVTDYVVPALVADGAL
jgi:8-oxo-dGTP diphosphatase